MDRTLGVARGLLHPEAGSRPARVSGAVASGIPGPGDRAAAPCSAMTHSQRPTWPTVWDTQDPRQLQHGLREGPSSHSHLGSRARDWGRGGAAAWGGAGPRLSALTPASFDLWTLDSWECPDDKVFLGNFHLSIKSRQPRQPARFSSGGCHSLGQQWWRPTGVLLPRGSPLAAEPSPESRGRLLAGCAASPASCRARASGRRLTPVPPFADSDLEQMHALQSPVSSSAKWG